MVSLIEYSGKPINKNRCFLPVNQNIDSKIGWKLLINQYSKKVIRQIEKEFFYLIEIV